MTKRSRIILIYLGLFLVAILFLSAYLQGRVYKIEYSEFKQHLGESDHVLSVVISEQEITGEIRIPPSYRPPDSPGSELEEVRKRREKSRRRELPRDDKVYFFSTDRPPNLDDAELLAQLHTLSIPVRAKLPSPIGMYLLILLPLGILILFGFAIFRQSQAGRAALSFGRSKARLYGEKIKTVSFEDVAGCDEAKVELEEVVDFLRNPKKYQRLGGRMPKGVLLVGPPGTGKTLLARAVAGEAKRPFFSLSGSEFVEMFVGVGAARVRDLFQQAKDNSPCIVFIDELDAVGRHRGAGLGGGHDEREQTLNQLLVELDGFDDNSGVIILAATNRPDVLDPALLRPGRFDRQVILDAPDLKGREAILAVHVRDKPIGDDVDLRHVAVSTPGFSGADLANVLNEAALLAARRDLEKIGRAEVEEAVERVIAGPERKSRRIGEAERRRVAYHEAGHALVAALSKHADPVRKISIIPRGRAALGYTMQYPEDDRYLIVKSALKDRLKSLLAGRAAERLIFDEHSTGAQDDLNKASEIARGMVCHFGMSEKIGPVALGRERRQVFLGRDIGQEERNYSDATALEIDAEVRRIIEEADQEASEILKKHRACLESIAETLLEREVLQGEDLDSILVRELGPLGVELPHVKKPTEGDGQAASDAANLKDEVPEAQGSGAKPEPPPGLKEGWAGAGS